MLYTPDDKTLLGFSDFIPANNADDTATLEDLGGGGGGGGGGGEGEADKPFQN